MEAEGSRRAAQNSPLLSRRESLVAHPCCLDATLAILDQYERSRRKAQLDSAERGFGMRKLPFVPMLICGPAHSMEVGWPGRRRREIRK